MHPEQSEIAEIYEMWKEAFAFDDGGSIDDYFEHNFRSEYCFVRRDHGNMISTLCAHPHKMHLGDHMIPIIFISGVITKKEYRHQGHMLALFDQVFAQHLDTCALYILQAYDPKIYEPLAFQMQYHTYETTLMDHYISTVKKSKILCPSDLLRVSDDFLSHYDGYLDRDLAYYETYMRQASAQNALLYGIYQEDELQGFVLGYPQDQTLRVEEIMYSSIVVYEQLLGLAQQSFTKVQVMQSTPYKTSKFQKHGNLMVRLGNKNLLENILQRKISSLEDVYGNLDKPLYHYDFY